MVYSIASVDVQRAMRRIVLGTLTLRRRKKMKNKTWMRNTAKKGIMAGLLLAVCAAVSACGGQNGKTKAENSAESQAVSQQADAGEIGKKLAEALTFEDELTLADQEMAGLLYGIDTAVSSSVYIGSGATAEEIAVFEFKTEQECKEAVALVEQRIEDQKEAFASYMPKEIKRLEGTVIKQYGRFLAVCVCDDSQKAEELLSEFLQ